MNSKIDKILNVATPVIGYDNDDMYGTMWGSRQLSVKQGLLPMKWSSSNENVWTVNNTGHLKSHGYGECSITVTNDFGSYTLYMPNLDQTGPSN